MNGYTQRKWASSLPLPFYMLDSADHATGKTGLTPSVSFSLNGGAWTATAGGTTEVGGGWYHWVPAAADILAPGHVVFKATSAGADDAFAGADLVAYDPLDGQNLGLTALPSVDSGTEGGVLTSGVGPGQLDVDGGQVLVRGLADDAINVDAVDVSVFQAAFDAYVPTEGYPSPGNMGTIGMMLVSILQAVSEYGIVGDQLTVRQLDGTTPAMTFTLDSATNPTTRARTS